MDIKIEFVKQKSGLIKISCINQIVDKKHRFKDWLNENSTKEIVNKIAKKTKITHDKLYYLNHKGGPALNTTDAHYLLACSYIESLPDYIKNRVKSPFQAFLKTINYRYENISKPSTTRQKKKTPNEPKEEKNEEIKEENNDEKKEEEQKEGVVENQAEISIQPQFLNQLFKFQEKEIRVFGTFDKPWFVAKDIAEILEYKNTNESINEHVEIEDKTTFGEVVKVGSKMLPPLKIKNFQKTTKLINESGLYSLIFGSKLPKAKEFKRFVTSEILPAIRKTGSYQIPTQNLAVKDISNVDLQLLDQKIIFPPNMFKIDQIARINTLIQIVETNRKQYHKKNCNYIKFIGEIEILNPNTKLMEKCLVFKFGEANCPDKREMGHNIDYGIKSKYVAIFESNRNNDAETEFSNKLKELGLQRTMEIKNKIRDELFICTPDYPIQNIIEMFRNIVEKHNKNSIDETIELKHKLELSNEQNNTKNKEIENLKLKLLLVQNNIQIPKDLM